MVPVQRYLIIRRNRRDRAGNAYVADTNNNTIRKLVIANGTVTTLAGQAGVTGGSDGIGTAVSFNGPSGIAVDAAGNLYVSDTLNHTIRKLTSGAQSRRSRAVPVRAALLTPPLCSTVPRAPGIGLGGSGDLFVADTNNNVVRRSSLRPALLLPWLDKLESPEAPTARKVSAIPLSSVLQSMLLAICMSQTRTITPARGCRLGSSQHTRRPGGIQRQCRWNG